MKGYEHLDAALKLLDKPGNEKGAIAHLLTAFLIMVVLDEPNEDFPNNLDKWKAVINGTPLQDS